VSLSNFTLNGNQGDGRHGNSTTGLRQGSEEAWYCGINLMNLNNIKIENVVVVNTPAYHIRFSNVGNVSVSGCVMKSHGFNTDGLHFDGPANDVAISNCDFTVGDDSIGLNCPEGYTGNISRVTVDNCTFNSWSLMRLYTTTYNTNKFNIDSVTVSNCSGKLREAAFLIGISGQSNPNSIDNLTLADCTLAAPTILGMAENFGNIFLRNVTLTPWVSPPWSNRICAFLGPSPQYGKVNFVGSNLSFENCRIYRSGHLIAAVILENDSTINNIAFNGFGVQDVDPAAAVPSLVGIGSGAIGEIVLNSVNSSNILALLSANEFYNVASVSGTGVLATGWEFPDPVMADEVPYISASSGLPSIKINGVVEPYTR
jgi:polygalacturonase